jgi:dTDP-4-dehydrorhamnose reductase
MKSILVSGGNGQLGSEINVLQSLFPAYNFDIKTRKELDLSSEESIRKVLSNSDYSYFINAGAYTAVDKAESDQSNCYAVNGMALYHICRYLPKGCRLIHISSDYVYHNDSTEPILESSLCNPQGTYARSKHQGEQFIMNMASQSIILRTSWVYSSYGNNFVKTMLRLGQSKDKLSIVSDQIGTPTYAKNIATAVMDIIEKLENKDIENSEFGIYNFTDSGQTSWADFARHIFASQDIQCQVEDISTESYGAAAPRPLWSVLSLDKIRRDYNIKTSPWTESLSDCLKLIESSYKD